MLLGRNISKAYGKQEILRSVDIDLQAGTITAVIGPSGSGKSTLLKALAMLEPADSGYVEIDGQRYTFPGTPEIGAASPWPALTTVFQQLFLWPHLTLRENIHLALRLQGISGPEKRPRPTPDIPALIRMFALEDAIDKYPNQTSVGQRQRAAIIRAAALEPKYLLLDEVTSALDVEHVGNVLDYLRDARSRGMCILLITHLVHFAANSADRVLFLDGGVVAESGDASILKDPQSDRLRQFLSLVRLAS